MDNKILLSICLLTYNEPQYFERTFEVYAKSNF